MQMQPTASQHNFRPMAEWAAPAGSWGLSAELATNSMQRETKTMLNKRLWLQAASSAAIIAVLGVSGPAFAEGYDISGITEDAALSARVPAKIREAGVLIGGSDNAFAPWEYLAGADGQTPEGIDIDLAGAMAAKLGLTYESRTAQFSSILPALGTNYDVGISAMSITNERMQTVNFVNYVEAGSEWAVKSGNPNGFDPANVCGSVVAVQTGSWYEGVITEESAACVAGGKDAIEILPFSVQTEAMTRVAAGGADAAIAGGATVLYAAKHSDGALEAVRPTGTLGGTGLVGIAVAKADMELAQLLSDTMNALMADGTYTAILDYWGVTAMAVPAAVINPQVDR